MIFHVRPNYTSRQTRWQGWQFNEPVQESDALQNGITFDSLWYRWNRLPIFLFKETLCVYERLNIFYKLCICERLQIISKTCTTEGYTSQRHCVWVGYVLHHYKAVYPHCIIKQALSTSGRLHHLKERVQMEHAIHFIRLASIKRHCTYVTELVIL